MTAGASSIPDPGAAAPQRLIIVPLLVFLALLPPEVRWESMLAVSICGALFVPAAWLGSGPRAATWMVPAGAGLALALIHTAPVPGAGVRPLATVVFAVALGLAASSAGRSQSGPRVARSIAVLGGLLALYAVYQWLWGLERLAARITTQVTLPDHQALLDRTVAGRAFANFSTPAALGGYLVLALPVTVYLAISAKPRWRAVGWGLAALQFAGLMATASATATAALMVALVSAAVFWGRGRRAFGLAVVALGVVLVTVVAFRGGKLISLTDPNSPWRLRGGNFRSAATMALDHPWRGVGPGGFAEHYPAYRRPGDNETRHAHNLPLELAAELGLPGGAIGAMLFFYVFLMPMLRARDDPEPWRRGLALGLGTFAIHNLADYTAFMPSLLFTAALARGVLSVDEDTPTTAPSGVTPRLFDALACAAVVAAAVLLSLGSLSDDARFEGRIAAYAGDHAQAQKLAARATALAPWEVGPAVFRARAAARDAASASPEVLELSLGLAERAVRLSPVNPAARETRALARLNAQDYPGAYADLVEAARLHPLEPRYAESRDRLRERLAPPSGQALESTTAPSGEGS